MSETATTFFGRGNKALMRLSESSIPKGCSTERQASAKFRIILGYVRLTVHRSDLALVHSKQLIFFCTGLPNHRAINLRPELI